MKKLWLLLALLPFAVSADLIHGLDSSGNRWPARINSAGQASISLISGEDQTLNSLWISLGGTAANYSAAASNNTKTTPGEVIGFYVNSTTSGTIRFWNDAVSTCDANAVTGVITPAVGWHFLPIKMGTGICVLTGGTIDVTVIYR